MERKKLTSREEITVMEGLSQASAAWLVGRSARTFRDSDAPRQPSGRYDASAVLAWARDQAASAASDPMLGDGGESPGLERYRLARASLAELDLFERRGELLSRDKARQALAMWASLIRRMGDSLMRRFGNEASQAVNDTLAECQLIVDRHFSDPAAVTAEAQTGPAIEAAKESNVDG